MVIICKILKYSQYKIMPFQVNCINNTEEYKVYIPKMRREENKPKDMLYHHHMYFRIDRNQQRKPSIMYSGLPHTTHIKYGKPHSRAKLYQAMF